jgi:hypothetical protein
MKSGAAEVRESEGKKGCGKKGGKEGGASSAKPHPVHMVLKGGRTEATPAAAPADPIAHHAR